MRGGNLLPLGHHRRVCKVSCLRFAIFIFEVLETATFSSSSLCRFRSSCSHSLHWCSRSIVLTVITGGLAQLCCCRSHCGRCCIMHLSLFGRRVLCRRGRGRAVSRWHQLRTLPCWIIQVGHWHRSVYGVSKQQRQPCVIRRAERLRGCGWLQRSGSKRDSLHCQHVQG